MCHSIRHFSHVTNLLRQKIPCKELRNVKREWRKSVGYSQFLIEKPIKASHWMNFWVVSYFLGQIIDPKYPCANWKTPTTKKILPVKSLFSFKTVHNPWIYNLVPNVCIFGRKFRVRILFWKSFSHFLCVIWRNKSLKAEF